MSAAQTLLFPFDLDDKVDQAARGVSSVCMRCGGTGWRLVASRADRCVTRCECRKQIAAAPAPKRKGHSSRSAHRFVDCKAAAAGERS